jgi:hypothetical protein
VIPHTRYGRLARRTDGSAFATGADRRPLKLDVEDDSVLPDEVALLTTFAEQPEVELWRTAADAYPRFEIGDRIGASEGASCDVRRSLSAIAQ